jgi:ATP-dependent Clp protease ATP-binding subunit ClpB
MEKHQIKIEWDRKALDFLANGYDISYGARSIKHEVERRVVNQIAVAHEYNLIEKGSHILITTDCQKDQLDLVKKKETSESAEEVNYDIRLKKVLKNNKFQDINLKMNYLGKYYIPEEKKN